jgi:hypothetical protein
LVLSHQTGVRIPVALPPLIISFSPDFRAFFALQG